MILRDAAALPGLTSVVAVLLGAQALAAQPGRELAPRLGRSPPPAGAGGPFAGKSYELSGYLAPLLGYESNYRVTAADVAGSAVWALEGGGELAYRPGDKLELHTELGAMARMPFSESRLLEYRLGNPTLALYHLAEKLELSIANHFEIERAKTPPIFLDVTAAPPAGQGEAAEGSIRTFSIAETLQPGVIYSLSESARAAAGPYLRAKKVDFIENPFGGEPDYSLLDLGFILTSSYRFKDLLRARLKYDFARRFFFGYPPRPPAHEPALQGNLGMNRHILGAQLRAQVRQTVGVLVGYSIRVTRDNGGFFDYLDHLPMAAISVDWAEKLRINATITYMRRGYSSRTPCAAEKDPDQPGGYIGSDCTLPAEAREPLVREEAAIAFDLNAAWTVLSWLQAIAIYEVEEASADIEDPLSPNHRLLTGVSFSY